MLNNMALHTLQPIQQYDIDQLYLFVREAKDKVKMWGDFSDLVQAEIDRRTPSNL